MRAFLLSLVLAIATWIPAQAANLDPATPDGLVASWVKALRTNDLKGLFALLPKEQQAQAERQYGDNISHADANDDLQVNAFLALMQQPGAVDMLMSQAQPALAQIKPDELVAGLQQIAGYLGMAAQQPAPAGVPAMDVAGLQGFVGDLAAWIPKAGLDDQAKLRAALAHVVAAIKGTGFTTAAQMRSLALKDLLGKVGPALAEIKAALAVYDLKLDALLDSFAVTKVDGDGDARTLTLGWTAFGKPHSTAVKMVKKDQAWTVAEGKDSPLAPYGQLLMMGMLMGGGFGGGAPAPEAPPAGGQGTKPAL